MPSPPIWAYASAPPYSRVVDLHNGIEHPDWFVDAKMNIVDSCLSSWCDETPDRIAVSHEDEPRGGRCVLRSSRSRSCSRAAIFWGSRRRPSRRG
jgi:acetyl-CoA synthetase